MKRVKYRGIGAAAAAVVVCAGAVAIPASGADSSKPGHGGTAKIKMVVNDDGLVFTGPRKVERGQRLKVVNRTFPGKVGPHTFTLLRKNRLPDTKREMKQCENLKLALCENIAKAHEFDPSTFVVNKPNVEVGRKGWDKAFGRTGDSWYTEKAGEHNTRRVSANDGRTLYYFCVVHPFMQGKIKVVK
ncbi:MAG: hypothetical protein R2718_07515 [Solirubrobacterales bacterium]|nr:hypothetical protein [Solirubrobacterales bacterium]